MSDIVSCAQEASGNAKTAAALNKSDHLRTLVRMSSSLEIKVKTDQHFAGVYVRIGQAQSGAGTILMQPVVLVMPGKPRPAGHEGVVAIAHGVGGNIAKVGRSAGGRLLRHANRLIAPDEDQLRAIHVVRFEQHTIPGWRSRSGRQSCAGRV